MLVYDCWEFILRHMDANCRFELSLTCPHLLHVENRLPFEINDLYLQTSQFQLNDCQYKIGVIRHYTRGETPNWVREENSLGGAPYDVEGYGDPESDVMKQRKERDRRACRTYAEVLTTKETLRTAEKLLSERLMFAQTPQGDAKNEEIKREITSLKLELNAQEEPMVVPPLYSHYLQVTRIPVNQKATCYSKVVLGRAVYGKPISAARDVLVQELLSKKTVINRLTISHEADFGSNFHHPLIKSAKFLEVMYPVQQEDLLRVSNNLAYFSDVAITSAFVPVLIQDWIFNKYPIGRHFAIHLKKFFRRVWRLRTALGRQPNVRMVQLAGGGIGSSYIFPMGVNTDLIAYFSYSKPNDFDNLIFHLVVHPKRYA